MSAVESGNEFDVGDMRLSKKPADKAGGLAPRSLGEGGVSARVLAVSMVLLLAVALAGFYVELKWHRIDHFAAGVPSTAAIVLLFLLAGAMALPVLRRLHLSRRELLSIYSIVLVGGPIVSTGILLWMIPHQVSYYYMGQVNPLWESTFFQYLPPWFAPTNADAVRRFFEGQGSVPWSVWWLPLGAWLSFLLALFFASLSLIALLQRQWVTNERLAFPLAQVPLEMVREPESQANQHRARLPSSPMFWLGIGISLVAAFTNTLRAMLPAFPAIPIGPLTVVPRQNVGPLAGLGDVNIVLWPWMIGLAYLVPKDLSLSIWLFWLVRLALSVAAIAAGATPERPEEMYGSTFPAPYFQGGGAVLALGVWGLWSARRHLAHAARVIVARTSSGLDRQEPMPYRLALAVLLVSLVWLVVFCILAGARPLFAFALVFLIVGYYVMWARLRAEAGLGFLDFPLEIEEGFVQVLGSSLLRPGDVVTMISTRWATAFGAGTTFEVCPGNALEAFKIADAAGINARRLTKAMLAGFILSVAVGVIIVMTGVYGHGYFGLGVTNSDYWLASQTREEGSRIFYHLTSPSRYNLGASIGIIAGAVVAIALGLLRIRFWWWPLHPLGYVAANTWGMQFYYMPFLVGWAWKSLVIRYGGLQLYRQLIPLAIGLLVGQLLNSGVWVLVAFATHGTIGTAVSLGTD
jgi:hypothetical protein